MKKGFTLVELSIVLVIIGLLIGGILTAQSMISTAQVQGTVRQIMQYDIAVNNFKTKFNRMPGANTLFDRSSTDSAWGATTTDSGLLDNYQNIAWFWPDLSLGVGLKNSAGTDYQPFGFWLTPGDASEVHFPKLKIKQGKSPNPPVLMGGSSNGRNLYAYLRPDFSAAWQTLHYDPLTPADTLAIDQKTDDGKPNSGNIVANKNGNQADQCVSGSNYDVSTSDFTCTMFIFMGIAQGGEI